MTTVPANPIGNLRINGRRLWARHMELAKIGRVADTGNCRLALSDEDAEARALLARWCVDAGLSVQADRAGNMFATRPGRNPTRPAVAAGSHLDTQPHGGRFDGISGVLAALEVIETMNDAGIETEAPIMLVNWTNEEGVRFSPGLLGSSWFRGQIEDDVLDNTLSSDGLRFAGEAERIGWRGDLRPSDLEIDSFFELHIEQGPILEKADLQVGVVTSVQGLRWLDVAVTGSDAHAGTTPMNARKDALLATSAMLVELSELGKSFCPDARVSVGSLRSQTNGPSTIAGRTDFVVDIRHPDHRTLKALSDNCKATCSEVGLRYGCDVQISMRIEVPPIEFDLECVAAVETAARDLGLSYTRLPSGALHDASNVAALAPTAMIFVPCKDGISHNVAEFASSEDLATGCDVLLHAMLSRAGILTAI